MTNRKAKMADREYAGPQNKREPHSRERLPTGLASPHPAPHLPGFVKALDLHGNHHQLGKGG